VGVVSRRPNCTLIERSDIQVGGFLSGACPRLNDTVYIFVFCGSPSSEDTSHEAVCQNADPTSRKRRHKSSSVLVTQDICLKARPHIPTSGRPGFCV